MVSWCNGSTRGFGSLGLGSIPGETRYLNPLTVEKEAVRGYVATPLRLILRLLMQKKFKFSHFGILEFLQFYYLSSVARS